MLIRKQELPANEKGKYHGLLLGFKKTPTLVCKAFLNIDILLLPNNVWISHIILK